MGAFGNMLMRLRRKPPVIFSRGKMVPPELRTKRGLLPLGSSAPPGGQSAVSRLEKHERERWAKKVGKHKLMPWERKRR